MASNLQSSGAQPLRPPIMGSTGPPQNYGASMPMQYRPVVPSQQVHQYAHANSQQFQSIGQGMPASNIGQTQMPHFPQSIQHLPLRAGQSGQGPPSSQSIPLSYMQPNRPMAPGSLQPHQNTQIPSNHLPNLAGAGAPLSSSYTFATSYGQPLNSINAPSQYQPASQIQTPLTSAGQSWSISGGQSAPLVTPLMQPTQQPPDVSSTVPSTPQPSSTEQSSSDWQEHAAVDGKRYYYNKKTRQSSWEKPLELMTPIERADASTVWKEFTTAEGRKYYYNKVTKQSKWTIPEDLKLAREQAEKVGNQTSITENGGVSLAGVASTTPPIELPSATPSILTPVSVSSVSSSPIPGVVATSVVTPHAVGSVSPCVSATTPTRISFDSSLVTPNAGGLSDVNPPITPLPDSVTATKGDLSLAPEAITTPANNTHDSLYLPNASSVPDGASTQDHEEAKRAMPVSQEINATPTEEKSLDEEPYIYATKLDAKNAFKALLEYANVESDWTWEKAMRVIINDKRYGALKTLGERKQAFNEYLGQRKKQDIEERRIKHKKAREDFTKMLEDCKELTSSSRWSKALTMFEDDERFSAVERTRDREDLYETYLVELQKKERAKAAEEHKRNIMEYRAFLESCEFIKVNSQWRKIQDQLEDDERCSRLEKIDRLEIFQEYIHDLEKKEEENKKIAKEQLRRAERKNRDEFRNLMEGHVATGILTAKTHWRDYCMKVKDLPQYLAVSSNTSGSTPKDLFEDVGEELEKQYQEDKAQLKDAMKNGKIALTSTWTFEKFKAEVLDDGNLKGISEINLKLIFDELLERLRDREEKEAKKRQRLADNFSDLLHSIKEITASSRWEECKPVLEESQEYRSIGGERLAKEIFEEYIAFLQEKAKEKERKREEEKAKKEKEREEKEKRKEKERKEKEREREKEKEKEKEKERLRKDEAVEIENVDVMIDDYASGLKEKKREREKEKERDRKHHHRSKRHHHSTADDVSSEKDEEPSKKSRRHSSGDRKKSRKHAYTTDSDSENRHKRHKRDRDGSRRYGGAYDDEELEDGEVGEDGEIC